MVTTPIDRQIKQLPLWPEKRLTLRSAIQQSIEGLQYYGSMYRHWTVSYSGGKDSSATASFVVWAIENGHVEPPESLTIVYADTRQEFPPLQQTAMAFLDDVQKKGYRSNVVLPEMDSRFHVYMAGYGVSSPSNRFRWCTRKLKMVPIKAYIKRLSTELGEKFLMITGLRLGESAARDQRIALSCSTDGGECGQGLFHSETDDSYDTYSPLLHWRVCHVWDWLYFEPHGFPMLTNIATVYGDGDVRTGCMGCPLIQEDRALKNLIKHPEYAHLSALQALQPLYTKLKGPQYRLRKTKLEYTANGQPQMKAQRLGPLTMEAREYLLDRVLDIQERAQVDMINTEEETRIRELWTLNAWPDGWSGQEKIGNQPIPRIQVAKDRQVAITPLLF